MPNCPTVPSPANEPEFPATPPIKRRLVWIEVARGIAASMVILLHASAHLEQELGSVSFRAALKPGSAAVDFFFVLSGFLIHYVTTRDVGNPRSIGKYLRKRILRIYPIYWAAMVVFLAMHFASSNSSAVLSPSSILREASLWPGEKGQALIVGVGWSLSYEIFFYVLFASFLVHRGAGRAVFGAWAVAALLRVAGVFSAPSNGALDLLTSEYSLLFPIGMAVAILIRRARHPRAGTVLLLGIPLFAVGWYLQSAGHLQHTGPLPRLVYGVCSAIVLYGLILLDYQGKSTTWRPLLILGECSYSIYLFHFVGIGVTAKAISILGLYGTTSPFLLVAMLIAGGLGAGVAAGLLVERPLVRWARRVA